jgi:hypothetical protein
MHAPALFASDAGAVAAVDQRGKVDPPSEKQDDPNHRQEPATARPPRRRHPFPAQQRHLGSTGAGRQPSRIDSSRCPGWRTSQAKPNRRPRGSVRRRQIFVARRRSLIADARTEAAQFGTQQHPAECLERRGLPYLASVDRSRRAAFATRSSWSNISVRRFPARSHHRRTRDA